MTISKAEAGKILADLEKRRRKGRVAATVRDVRAGAVERARNPHGFTPRDWKHFEEVASAAEAEGEFEGEGVMSSKGYVTVAPDGLSHAGRYIPRKDWP